MSLIKLKFVSFVWLQLQVWRHKNQILLFRIPSNLKYKRFNRGSLLHVFPSQSCLMRYCSSPPFKNILATHQERWKQNYQTPETAVARSGDDICSSRSGSSCASAVPISHYCSAQTAEGEATRLSSSRRRRKCQSYFRKLALPGGGHRRARRRRSTAPPLPVFPKPVRVVGFTSLTAPPPSPPPPAHLLFGSRSSSSTAAAPVSPQTRRLMVAVKSEIEPNGSGDKSLSV